MQQRNTTFGLRLLQYHKKQQIYVALVGHRISRTTVLRINLTSDLPVEGDVIKHVVFDQPQRKHLIIFERERHSVSELWIICVTWL